MKRAGRGAVSVALAGLATAALGCTRPTIEAAAPSAAAPRESALNPSRPSLFIAGSGTNQWRYTDAPDADAFRHAAADAVAVGSRLSNTAMTG